MPVTITISEDKSGVWFATSEDVPTLFCAATSLPKICESIGIALSDPNEKPNPDDPLIYWLNGAAIIEEYLKVAIAENPADAPFPLVGREAAIWHEAQADAYRHALEMMGPPT